MLEWRQLFLPFLLTTAGSAVSPPISNTTMELVNETAQRWRDWGYIYYIVNRTELYSNTHYLVLPKDSYVYKARIEGKIVWLAQVPIGNAVTQFLLHHGHAVIKPLPSILQR